MDSPPTPTPLPRRSLARTVRGAWRWRPHAGLLAALLLATSLLIALAAASPMRSAPFRLLAQAEFVGFVVKGDVRLAFDVIDWELHGLQPGDTPNAPPIMLARPAEAGNAPAERFELWLREGDEITLQQLQTRSGRPRFALALPLSRVPMAMQFAPSATLPLQAGPDGKRIPRHVAANLRGEIGGRGEAALVFGIAHMSDETRPRVAVSKLGFGLPQPDGRVQTGITGGSLLFLDQPSAELRLWRGADLRLHDIDAELASLALSAQGIEVQIAGVTGDAVLHVGTSAESQRTRRVMPSYYDMLQGDPVLGVLLAFAGFITGLAGLLLSAAQVSMRLATTLRRWSGE